jgi:hypothetical protein
MLLLMKCHDVERNPGPGDNELHSTLLQLTEHLANNTGIVMQVKEQNDRMTRDMKNNNEALIKDMDFIKHTVQEIAQTVHNNTVRLDQHHAMLQELSLKTQSLEIRLERIEAKQRMKNIKILGLHESPSETANSVQQLVVDMLQHFYPDLGHSQHSIERAHRVGRRGGQGPRPVIVTFSRHALTMAVMNDKVARRRMHDDGVKIAPDYTPSQQAQLQQLWQQGKRGVLR